MAKTEEETALIIPPIHEIEGYEKYIALKREAEVIFSDAKKFQVRSQPTMDEAAQKRDNIAILRKRLKQIKDKYIKPINLRKQEILDLFKEIDDRKLVLAFEIYGDKMVSYQHFLEKEEQRRLEAIRKKEEEERKRKEQEFLEAQKRLEGAETEEEAEAATEEAVKAQEALEKTYEAPKPTPKIAPKIRRTAGGGATFFKEVRKCEVVNFALLPKEYKKEIADMDKIVAVVNAGVSSIAGVRIWVEKKPITRTGRF